jgi:hypothetical protein
LYPLTVDVLGFHDSLTDGGVFAAAVKFTPALLALLTVTLELAGVKMKLELLGVTV